MECAHVAPRQEASDKKMLGQSSAAIQATEGRNKVRLKIA